MSDVKMFDIPGSDNVFIIYMVVCKADNIEGILEYFRAISEAYDVVKREGKK